MKIFLAQPSPVPIRYPFQKRNMARLRAVSDKIDKLQTALLRPINPRLAHYLQRRSYDKALEFLGPL